MSGNNAPLQDQLALPSGIAIASAGIGNFVKPLFAPLAGLAGGLLTAQVGLYYLVQNHHPDLMSTIHNCLRDKGNNMRCGNVHKYVLGASLVASFIVKPWIVFITCFGAGFLLAVEMHFGKLKREVKQVAGTPEAFNA